MKRLLLVTTLCLIAALGYVNFHVSHRPDFIHIGGTSINEDLWKQLNFLGKEIRNGSALEMQSAYPEGFIFFNVMYGLAWCAIAQSAKDNDSINHFAQGEIGLVLNEVLAPNAQAQFRSSSSLKYEAFYTGWTTYLSGKKLESQKIEARDSASIEAFKLGCKNIAANFIQSKSPFPESYPGASWPADAFSCVAALSAHDRLFPPVYEKLISNWLEKCKKNLDHRDLIPHSSIAESGEVNEPSMGSSQSLILNFLYEIDPVYGRECYDQFKKLFLFSRLYLPAFREYPKGVHGKGHIDSGPVLFGVGAVASMVGSRTAYLYGDQALSRSIKNCVNAFAFVSNTQYERKYLWGQWAMADAFIAWADSVENSALAPEKLSETIQAFRWLSLTISLVLLALSYWAFKK